MANKLKKMHLTSVDLVRAGANQEADICLFKSASPSEATETPSEHETNLFKRFINWLNKSSEEPENEPTDPNMVLAYTEALEKSVQSIREDNTINDTEKVQLLYKSFQQFNCAVTGKAPEEEKTVEKSDPNRFDVIQEVKKFNPYHGKDGRFASASGGGATSFTIRTKDPAKQHLADRAMMREAERTSAIAVDGPSKTKAFVDDYIKKHPEVAEEAKKYKDVLDNVKNFQKNNPDAEEGTYSAVTGKLVNPSSGYAVTFHQNKTADNPYGDYDSDTYAKMCAIAKRETGSKDVYIGFFGNAEVSFNCSAPGQAMKFAVEHNQHSIFDCSKFETVENKKYNKNTNPIEGY